MKFYLASSWKSRERAALVASTIESFIDLKLESTSTWLDLALSEEGMSEKEVALRDCYDIQRAPLFIFMESGIPSAGRFWELGYSTALSQLTPRTNIYLNISSKPKMTTIFTDLCDHKVYNFFELYELLWQLTK